MNVDETLKRLQGHRGVEGVVIATHAGAAIRSSFADEETTRRYAAAMSRLAGSASEAVQSVDEANGVKFLRVRTNTNEVMISRDSEYVLIVIQKPSVE